MQTKSEPYQIRSSGSCPVVIWHAMCDFGSKSWDKGVEKLISHMDKTEKGAETWAVAFDFCRLSGKTEALNLLTEKYAAVFGKPPPEWVNTPAVALEEALMSKGVVVNILSASIPESAQYEAATAKLSSEKTALLIKFSPGKPLSWQMQAVERFAKLVNSAFVLKLPIFGENLEVAVAHILKINADSRTQSDWDILFFCLTHLLKVDDFEEQAMEYAMAKGISPPSYAAPLVGDKSKWFGAPEGVAVEVSEDDPNAVLPVSGSLPLGFHILRGKILQRAQKSNVVVIDLQSVSRADWTSAMDILSLHEQLALSSKSLIVFKPSPLLNKMLIAVGFPISSIKV